MHWGGGWGVVRGVGTAGEKVTWLCKFTPNSNSTPQIKQEVRQLNRGNRDMNELNTSKEK